jgi:four helix bundle protein
VRNGEWGKICGLENIYLEMSRIKEFQKRAKQIGIDVIYLCRELPNTSEFRIIQRQIIRSATSVGANYRAVSRAKSDADFIHKLTIVEEEADETIYWLESPKFCTFNYWSGSTSIFAIISLEALL